MSHEPRRVLVPTDFSIASDGALKTGMALAERFDAELHALYVRPLLGAPDGLVAQTASEQAVLDDVEKQLHFLELRARGALDELAGGHEGVRYKGHIERGVSVPSTILECVKNYGCDLVIMGTHGRRAVSRMLMGSVAERVVRLSPVPVITTRQGVEERFPPAKILVGFDSSEDSVEALRHAGDWARLLGSELIVLHVVEPVVYPDFYAYPTRKEYDEKVVRRSHQALEQAAVEHAPGVEVETHVVQGHAAKCIVDFAEMHGCDLVVLATHGLSGVAHALLGSVAERVVRTADVPVMTVRA